MGIFDRLFKPFEPNVGKLEKKKNIKGLIKALKYQKDWDVRKNAVKALGKIGDARAVRPLIAILINDVHAAEPVPEALVKIGKTAVEPLIAVINNTNLEIGRIRSHAALALKEIGWNPSNQAEQISYLIATKKWDELVKTGKPAVDFLIPALKEKDLYVYGKVVDTLGDIGDSRAIIPLTNALSNCNWRAKGLVEEALIKLRNSAVQSLTALNDKNIQNNEQIRIQDVAKLKEKKDVKGLINALRYRKDGAIRALAAEALGKIGDAQTIKPLITALKDKERSVRLVAAWALGKSNDAQAIDPLAITLRDEDKDVRVVAAKALEEIGNKQAVKPLVAALRDEKSEDVRGVIARGLVKIGVPAVKPLIDALKDKDLEVRWATAWTLGEIGDKQAIEPLFVALTIENNEGLLGAILEALIKFGELAVEPLITMLRNENKLELVQQTAAIMVLLKIGAPAVEPLVAMLRGKSSDVRKAIVGGIAAFRDKNPDLQEVAAAVLGRIGDTQSVEAEKITLTSDQQLALFLPLTMLQQLTFDPKAVIFNNMVIKLPLEVAEWAISYAEHISKANEFFKKKDFREAISAFQEILNQIPEAAIILMNIGVCYAEMGDKESAQTWLNKSLKATPTEQKEWVLENMRRLQKKKNHR